MGHLRKRGKNYFAVIYVKGQYVERSLKTGDPKEAEKRMLELERKAGEEGLGSHESMKLSDFLDLWLDLYAKVNLRGSTYDTYEAAVKHIKGDLGGIKLGDMKAIHLQQYYAKKLKDGLSNTTVHYHHKVLRKALSCAVDWEYITKNPALKAKPPKPNDFKPTTWTLEESKRFLETAQGNRNFAIYATVLLTGLRRGEVLGLKRTDFHPKSGYLEVVRQLVCTRQGVVVHPAKTKKGRRSVLIGPVLVDILLRHIEMIDEEKKHAKEWHEEGWLFPNRVGRHIDPNNLARRSFQTLIKKAGVPRIRFHDLRHTHITDLLEAGVHLKVAGERAGHSSVSITGDIYSHVRNPIQREAALLSEQRLFGDWQDIGKMQEA